MAAARLVARRHRQAELSQRTKVHVHWKSLTQDSLLNSLSSPKKD